MMTTSAPKTILITGATGGIGRAAALQLAGLGHCVVVVGRDQKKCIAVVQEIAQRTGAPAGWLEADLSSQSQVRRLAKEFKSRFEHLDVLINNAGAIFHRRFETTDGIEMGWAVNYFQTFLLTHLLLDRLKARTPSRVINLTSIYHWAVSLNPDNLSERGLYTGWSVYGRTKLACLYFTNELARRLQGSGVTANAIHPGLVLTGIGKKSGWLLRTVFRFVDLFSISAEQGAAGLVNLAVNPALEGVTGQYFKGLKPAPSSPISRDAEIARRLWDVSLRLTRLAPEETTTRF